VRVATRNANVQTATRRVRRIAPALSAPEGTRAEALMLLGKAPHPETQNTMLDLDGAKMFIDQLEMLEVKTRGNLKADESKLLKQSLTALRLAFVQAIDSQSPSTAAEEPKEPAAPAHPPETSSAPDQASTPGSEEEARKKFSKKY